MAVYLGSQNVGVGVVTKLQAQVNNEDITITENGVYTKSSEDFTGLGTVTVNVKPDTSNLPLIPALSTDFNYIGLTAHVSSTNGPIGGMIFGDMNYNNISNIFDYTYIPTLTYTE